MLKYSTLSVFSVNRDEILEVQTMSSPPPHLQSLYLHGKSEMLPCWISKLNNLVALGLVFSRLTDDPVKVFQALPSLKSLGLFCGYDEEEVHFEGGFLKLKWLSLSGLNSIIIEKGALPLLQELAIGACPQQRQVPSGIQHLKDLKELSFAGMPDDSTQRLPCNGGEDYWMVKNVPCLQYDGIYDPNDETSYAAEVKRYFG
jgi:disease resistance protein RPM1